MLSTADTIAEDGEMSAMKLCGVRVYVDDYAAAKRFYADTLGLPLAWDIPDAGAFGADVGGSSLIVEAESTDGPDADLVGRFVGPWDPRSRFGQVRDWRQRR